MHTVSPVVRPAKADDYGSVAQLIYRSHTISFAQFASDDWVSSRKLDDYLGRWRATLATPSPDDMTFVAVLNGVIVGTVRTNRPTSPQFESDAQLNAMHVEPELIGRGIGTILMESALAFIKLRCYKRVELGVIASNAGARRFYESNGWILLRELSDGIEGVPVVIYDLSG